MFPLVSARNTAPIWSTCNINSVACYLLDAEITHLILNTEVMQVMSFVVTPTIRRVLGASLALILAFSCQQGFAHGDVVPQSVDTSTLPQLGPKWLEANPYSTGAAHKEALRIGTSAYNQNCARCHGLEAISGGISPDLRKIDNDCADLADDVKKNACYQEINEYFVATVRRGRARDGRVYMPPFEGILSQEAIWSIKTYLETRRER
jgi:cytochrome c-550 PedF